MTRSPEARLAALPAGQHIRYWRMRERRGYVWMAFFWDETGRRHKRTLGATLPPVRPDWPCQHPEKHAFLLPTTEAERLEAQERGRRANALRKVRSNQYQKRRKHA
jgi:hypothetical protein